MLVSVVVEGSTDEAVARRILDYAGHTVQASYLAGGKALLDPRLPGYNHAAQWRYWLVLRDLDHDAPCPGRLVAKLLPHPAPHMAFRLAVRSIEAWLLGDPDTLAAFLSVRPQLVPADPEALAHPKDSMVNLARRSRARRVREDMVPRPGSGARIGPGYSSRLLEYALHRWRPEVAAVGCPSLQRCLRVVQAWPK